LRRHQYPLVNDSVGLVFHSALLVPYFSWKFSHARHHAGTGSLERDEVFVPASASQVDTAPWQSTPLARLGLLAATLTVGWPLYLVKNAGSRKYAGQHADHFSPWSPVFKTRRERALVLLSDAALLVVGAALWQATAVVGFAWVCKAYFAPYLMVNFWLVMITLLQHTHPSLPHFTGAEWEWLRGACSTVDRDYGWVLNTLHHHIADTHVAHHLFSALPHYHAREATAALRSVMGPYYARDERNVFAAMLSDWAACEYVDADAGASPHVLWYRAGHPSAAQKA
jgi:omega-6 fatty acid desaturase (delta-12 desaturase)